jgi:phosphoglycerate dehydrogenase-like enzyme
MTARVVCLSPFSEQAVRDVIDPKHQVEVVLVPDPPAQEAVLEATHLAHLVIADQRHKHRIDRRVLENMRNCRLIQAASVGFDTVDHRAAAELGIPVANCAGYNREAVADWTVLAILALLRRGAWADRQMRTGWWSQQELFGHQLGALTVGIVGLGNVGGTVARRLTGFGSRVVYADPDPSREFPGAERVELEELLATADVVTVHVPLDVDTRGLMDREAFARMKPGAFFVNASRGPVVDEAALLHALDSGHLAGAGLDVYETEPLAHDSPLRKVDRVFLSPHFAGTTVEARQRLFEMIGTNLNRVLDGEAAFNIVNQVAIPS